MDKFGTILGFLVGSLLVIFGITWPDHLSNYYMYRLQVHETAITEMQDSGVPPQQIREKQKEFEQFQNSWQAGITRFIDLKSILIVLGGAYSAALIAFPFRISIRAFLFIARIFTYQSRQEEFLEVHNTILALADKRVNNDLITDEEVAAINNIYLRQWIQDFISVDLVSEEMMLEIIRSEIEMYNYRSFEEIDVLEFLGAAAPAFGMIGTVVGLILMLGNSTGDIAGVMGGMSVALITTLYGVLLAQLFFLPSASKRYQLKETNIMMMEMIREGVVYLRRRELAEVASQDLIIYLPEKMRKQLTASKLAAMKSGDLGL